MTFKSFAAVILAAILLFTLAACGKTQPPAASGKLDSAAGQTEQQNDVETSANEDSSPHGDEVSEDESAPAGSGEASEEEPWQAALAKDSFEKYGVLPEYYEDLGDGIYQVYVEVGGEIVFIGTPREMAERAQTITAEYLRKSL